MNPQSREDRGGFPSASSALFASLRLHHITISNQPLHGEPSCRVPAAASGGGRSRLLLFLRWCCGLFPVQPLTDREQNLGIGDEVRGETRDDDGHAWVDALVRFDGKFHVLARPLGLVKRQHDAPRGNVPRPDHLFERHRVEVGFLVPLLAKDNFKQTGICLVG